MLKTFKACLKDGQLEWLEDHPDLGNEPLQVYVTVLEPDSAPVAKTRGQRMAEALDRLAAINGFEGVDSVQWQQQIRGDRPLPGR